MNKKYTILIVDDQSANLQFLTQILENEDYDIRATTDAFMAIQAVSTNPVDLILLDINMPDINGFEVCNKIKLLDTCSHIPIIFISALDDIQHKIKAFENGGVDYITKPFEPQEVLARVKTQLKIYNSQKKITALLEQQDMFVKKIMHEINTPLSIISLNVDSIERKYGLQNELTAIKASTKTLSSIYGDLSYIVKKELRDYEIKSINLIQFLSSRIIFFDEMAQEKNIEIEFFSDLDNVSIQINEYELERIVDNTISNAIKYSYENSFIEIGLEFSDNQLFLQIKDFGMGIENPENIFKPYYQDSSKNLGLGLGLSIVQEICKKYNILIDVSSKKNEGTLVQYNLSKVAK